MLISAVVERALRVLLGSTKTPSDGVKDRCLEALQALLTDMPGTIGAKWSDVVVSADYTAGEDERITIASGSPTITKPTLIYLSDLSGVPTGTTYSATTMRPPRDGARLQIVTQSSGASELWFWRSDKAAWIAADGLAYADECPLPTEMDRFLAAMLAVELSAEYGEPLQPVTVALNEKGWARLRARYGARKVVACDPALLINSHQSYAPGMELSE